MITDAQITQILGADAAGTAWAEGLKPGDEFLGCNPEAEKRGYRGLNLFAFTNAALDVLDKHRLSTDGKGKVTSYTLKTTSQGN